ncbi:ABC transporter substrate-binding protein [Pseudonocardia pini]|uniref:ABC transporter substrate-binding protein n=1 Tax=Pseudonocardia pini TaxID=2758030 RepID=UPI0015F04465|nr:ABC transporter substrate-binding protein [Pseudonocardia pini]
MRPLRSLGALLAGTALLAGCAAGGGTAQGTGTDAPAEMVVATGAMPVSGNPDRVATGDYFLNTHGFLVRAKYIPDERSGQLKTSDFEFEGVLAESYDVSPDNLTYTFHLREGLLSPQGNPLDADDVLYSFERKWNGKGSLVAPIFAPALTDPATQITKIDESTVAFTVRRPGEGLHLLSNLSQVAGTILDREVLEQHATPTDPYAADWSAERTNQAFGFGPYTTESFTDAEFVLAANPAYALGAPAVPRVTYRVVADAATRATALTAGEVDAALGLKPADMANLESSDAARAYSFDTSVAILTLHTVVTHAPFDDLRVRKALALAVPYEEISGNVYRDRILLTPGRLDPTAPNYDGEGIEPSRFDPAAAKALLAEAGHPGGVPFTLTVGTTDQAVLDAAVQLQSFAREGGFDITIANATDAQIAAERPQGVWDAFLAVQSATNASPAYQLGIFFSNAPFNTSRWMDAGLDARIDQGLQVSDFAGSQAGREWNTAERYLLENQPSIWIGRTQPSNAFAPWVQGVTNRMDKSLDLTMVKPA